MANGEEATIRTIVLAADCNAFPVVFEMLGETVVVQPFESLRLAVTGPRDATLTVGYGPHGVSVFRDPELEVRVYDHRGELLAIAGW